MDIQDFKTTRFNVIGAQSKLTGELHFEGPTTICGQVNGTLVSVARLVLDRQSDMLGVIRGHDVEISGSFSGEIHCTGTLSIKAGSKVEGKLHAAKLVIYPGAVVDIQGSAEANALS